MYIDITTTVVKTASIDQYQIEEIIKGHFSGIGEKITIAWKIEYGYVSGCTITGSTTEHNTSKSPQNA